VSKKIFLAGKVLAIGCSFTMHTQKSKSKKIFPTSLVNFNNLKNITLNYKIDKKNSLL
jgi:hypothetical protein